MPSGSIKTISQNIKLFLQISFHNGVGALNCDIFATTLRVCHQLSPHLLFHPVDSRVWAGEDRKRDGAHHRAGADSHVWDGLDRERTLQVGHKLSWRALMLPFVKRRLGNLFLPWFYSLVPTNRCVRSLQCHLQSAGWPPQETQDPACCCPTHTALH